MKIQWVAAVYQWLKNKTTEMIITNRRVVLKRGIISVHTSEIRNVKVETVRLHQGILGRLLGYSDLATKHCVLNTTFMHKISYDKESKFRTPEIAPIFKMFSEFQGPKSNMVPVVGPSGIVKNPRFQ